MEALDPMTTFRDHFSNVSSQYASFRPNYPRQRFEWLASIAPSRELAWDCEKVQPKPRGKRLEFNV